MLVGQRRPNFMCGASVQATVGQGPPYGRGENARRAAIGAVRPVNSNPESRTTGATSVIGWAPAHHELRTAVTQCLPVQSTACNGV